MARHEAYVVDLQRIILMMLVVVVFVWPKRCESFFLLCHLIHGISFHTKVQFFSSFNCGIVWARRVQNPLIKIVCADNFTFRKRTNEKTVLLVSSLCCSSVGLTVQPFYSRLANEMEMRRVWMNESAAQPLRITKMALKANDVHFMTLAYIWCTIANTGNWHLNSWSRSGNNKTSISISMTFDKIEMEWKIIPIFHVWFPSPHSTPFEVAPKVTRKPRSKSRNEWNRAAYYVSQRQENRIRKATLERLNPIRIYF